jgi:uncharacterized protein YceK
MAYRAICVALALSSLPVEGCGTVSNLVKPGPEGGKTPFGGVRQDVSCIKKAVNGDAGDKTPSKSESDQYPQMALFMLCAMDLPFTLLGDAVTWPYSVSYTCINEPVPTPPVTVAPALSEASPPEPIAKPTKLP